MINKSIVTKNIKLYLTSFFMFNLGRTLPHAILTIFLLDSGMSLVQITYIQIIFMFTVFVLEIPSGYIGDHWSRKNLYMISILLILASYLLIYFWHDNFYILIIAWIFYGASSAMNSGTLDNEIINQMKFKNLDIKKMIIYSSYTVSISSMTGALLGSFLYLYIHQSIYIISLAFFVLSFLLSLPFKSTQTFKKKSKVLDKKTSFIYDLKNVIKDPIIQNFMIIFFLMSFFLQPYYQYWQVLFDNKGVSIGLFGLMYIVFQFASILGNYLYDKINYKEIYTLIILFLLFVLSTFGFYLENIYIFIGIFITMLVLFTVYFQHINFELRKYSKEDNISTITSFTGTSNNLGAFLFLFSFTITINQMSLESNYVLYFIIFSIGSIIINIKRMK